MNFPSLGVFLHLEKNADNLLASFQNSRLFFFKFFTSCFKEAYQKLFWDWL